MNLLNRTTRHCSFIAVVLILLSAPGLAQVYKTVDENGNVTFTDRPPDAGAEPIKLRPISVIEAPDYGPSDAGQETGAGMEDDGAMSLRGLRRNYADFSIVNPAQEETIWNPAAPVTMTWSTRNPLQDGMKVIVLLDGREYERTTERVISLGRLERGEHTVQAQIADANNRRIAVADAVTFFIRQPTVFNRARRATGGGR